MLLIKANKNESAFKSGLKEQFWDGNQPLAHFNNAWRRQCSAFYDNRRAGGPPAHALQVGPQD